MLAQGLRFFGVGGAATLVHVVVALVTQAGLGASDLVANLAGWFSAVTLSYFGHLHMTFKVAPAHSTHVPRFVITSVLGIAISSALVSLVTGLGGSFAAAMGFVFVGVPAVTFLLLYLWVFDDRTFEVHLCVSELLIPVLVGLVVLVVFWGQTLNHDVVWYHVATRKWIDGVGLYSDIVEVNPPLNFYLTLPVIWLSDLTGLGDTNAQYVVIAAITVVSLWLVIWELQSIKSIVGKERFVLLAGIGVVLIILPLRDVGQREHLFILFILPWLTSRIAPSTGRTGREIALVCLASLGMCLKPFFILFPAVILIYGAVMKRSVTALFSVSTMVFFIVGLAYIAVVALLHPVYLTEILPMARLVYGAFGSDFMLALRYTNPALWVLVVAGVWTLTRISAPTGTRVFFLAAFAGVASYVWQGTGFGYHTLPFVVFGAIGCLFACRDPLCRPMAVVALVALLIVTSHRGYYENWAINRIVPVAQAVGPVERLLVVTTHVSAGPIVAEALGVEWVSNYPSQWLVPGALSALDRIDCSANADLCGEIKKVADRNRDDLVTVMLDAQPDLIVFDKDPGYFDARYFDWHAWLGTKPAFSGIMDSYSQLAEGDRFTYWVRQPSFTE